MEKIFLLKADLIVKSLGLNKDDAVAIFLINLSRNMRQKAKGGSMNNLINQKTVDTSHLTPIEIALGVDENRMTTAKKLYDFWS